MREVSVIGIGSTKFGILEGKGLKEMGTMACREAMQDANISSNKIQAFYVGNFSSGMLERQENIAPLIANSLGLRREISCTKVEGACCSSGIAIREAFLLIAAGVYDIVLVGGVEKMSAASRELFTAALASALDKETEGIAGLTFPGFFAMLARRHMHEYGTTIEQMGMVSFKNHNNSVVNPRARFRKPVAFEEIMNSRLITDPLKLHDCCPIADGSAAAVLCATEIAEEFTDNPVDIIGSAHTCGYSTLYEMNDAIGLPATITSAKQAYDMAHVGPGDIDVVELHDCFTIAEIIDSEDLGFFKKGEGGRAVEDGLTKVDGRIPINPSGGLLSKGHPVGATGCGQIYEIVKQLRGEHENQIEGAEVGLTHNAGGTGAVVTVHILSKR